ncbi:DNA-binding MarR family transcriptional regulator [Actinoallomurus bryophytorum]|uniref:DNA-binding MarR family transcriptional regulator n=1 Tax=Actinoallomurus bryophytorum TaxID=1490222 RepID=A0A543CCC8_9ACTN|nr:DNA-binding MarR family transcriptional regulator [Actinoallomurus bryophytorum]
MTEETDVTPELARNAGDLRVRMARLARRLRQEDGGHALTMSQLTALGRLVRLGPATLSELAAGERVRPQSMARAIDALETAGMVRRTPHPTDRRQNVIRLTGNGRAVIADNRLRRDAWLARAMAAALSPEERDLLTRAGGLMERLADLTEEGVPGTYVPGTGD